MVKYCPGVPTTCNRCNHSITHFLSGQLGLGDRESRNRPTQIKDIKANIIRAACGWNHSLFLSGTSCLYQNLEADHGQIFVCGKGGEGRIH